MKKYKEYIDVGLPWYPHGIPSHWSLIRHKNVLTEHKELVGKNSANYTLLSLTLNGVIIRDISEGKGKFAKDYHKYVVVDEGDFVFCLFDVEETPRTVGLSKHHGMITGAYDVFKPHGLNPEYFYYYYLALDNVKALKPLYSGLRKVIPYPSFMAMKVPVPPKNEQDQIVRYLDWKVSRINRLIHGYQRQIKLLEERRLTLVDNVVTKGLNPNAEMNDSGVYWLGEIPNNWDVIRAKYLFKKEKREPLENDEVVTCFRDGEVTLRKNRRTTGFTESLQENGYQHVCKGDLVIHVMDAFAGAIGISDSDGKGTPVYHCCTPLRNDVYVPYYMHFLRMMAHVGYIQSLYRGIRERSTNFTFDVFSAQMLAMPSFEEQQEIVAYIEQQTAQINLLKGKIAKQISFLEEYRTRLISDVVTGQIDVRDIEIPDYTFEEDNSSSAETDCIEEVSDDAE